MNAFADLVEVGQQPTRMTVEEWKAEGTRRFSADQMKWRFKCPSCGNVVTPEDYKKVGAPENVIAYSCVGRWMPKTTATIFEKGKGFCNYAGGGLFKLNPITVIDEEGRETQVFAFAEGQQAQ